MEEVLEVLLGCLKGRFFWMRAMTFQNQGTLDQAGII